MINWYCGWCLILSAFLSGAIIGLFFHNEEFLGGYASFRRRLLRLGHIAMAALGIINVLYNLSPATSAPSHETWSASIGFVAGGITMPAVCFLTAWRVGFRYLFVIPVGALVLAVIETLRTGLP